MDQLARIQEAFSSLHHLFIIDSAPSNKTVLEYLRDSLPSIAEGSWKDRLEFGGIFVNGVPISQDGTLPFPCKVEYYEPKFDIVTASDFYPAFSTDWIVYEDQWLIVCYKPARLPTMPAKEQNAYNLKSYLEKYLACDLHCPSRLDMSTQGLVIASKHSGMHKPLQQLFERREITKRYLFFTTGSLPQSPTSVNSPIGKSPDHPVLRTPFGKDAKEALTIFKPIANGSIDANGKNITGHFIEALPQTGRTHQIRVHAASIGCPVAGDRFYGGVEYSPLCLLSFALSFRHPATEEAINIVLPDALRPHWAIISGS